MAIHVRVAVHGFGTCVKEGVRLRHDRREMAFEQLEATDRFRVHHVQSLPVEKRRRGEKVGGKVPASFEVLRDGGIRSRTRLLCVRNKATRTDPPGIPYGGPKRVVDAMHEEDSLYLVDHLAPLEVSACEVASEIYGLAAMLRHLLRRHAIVALRRMVPPRFGKDIGRRRAKSARRLRFAHVAPPCDKSAARYDRRVWRHPECGVTAHIGRSGLLFEPIRIRRQFERSTKRGHRIVHLRINARKSHFQGAVACLVELRRRVNDELPFRRFRSILDMCASSLAETDFPHVHRMRHCTCGQHGHAAHIHCRSTLHHVQSFPLFPT